MRGEVVGEVLVVLDVEIIGFLEGLHAVIRGFTRHFGTDEPSHFLLECEGPRPHHARRLGGVGDFPAMLVVLGH